jgi:hypothetical protein
VNSFSLLYWQTLQRRIFFAGCLLGCLFGALFARGPFAAHVLFLPFEDKVKLDESWDLSVDIPRWYATTVDTIGSRDTLVKTVDFDTVLAAISRNGWKRSQFLQQGVIQRLAAVYDADIVITGTVNKFVVMKRALNGNGAFGGSTGFDANTSGNGGISGTAQMQSYTATSKMDIVEYDGRTGEQIGKIVLDSKARDGGLKIWLPIQPENDEINFYNMSHSPFGSEYFMKNPVSTMMKDFSQRIRESAKARIPQIALAPDTTRDFISGKILDRTGPDIYVNLGQKDNVILGDTLEILKPVRPIVQNNDTLGWAEEPAGLARMRTIKTAHFGQATIVSQQDSVQAGWTVRIKVR